MKPTRLARAREAMTSAGFDTCLVLDGNNLRWLTGFTGSNGGAILTASEVHLFTDGRYTLQASQEASGAAIQITTDPVIQACAQMLSELGAKKTAIEEDALTVKQYKSLKKIVKKKTVKDGAGLINKLRQVKDFDEIESIRQAVAITDSTFTKLLTKIKPGITERDLARELVYILGKQGADGESFPCIVASGPRSALPHAAPTERKLQPGDSLILDFGAKYDGYAGDLTRTVVLGEASDRLRGIYETVLKAQIAAIEAIKPGVHGRQVDSVAREIIANTGYGDNFGHGTGHQIGLDVHDGPALSQKSDVVLEAGMMITVEPGIYIEGFGGVRIEDDVLVTENGFEVLTRSRKELIELPV